MHYLHIKTPSLYKKYLPYPLFIRQRDQTLFTHQDTSTTQGEFVITLLTRQDTITIQTASTVTAVYTSRRTNTIHTLIHQHYTRGIVIKLFTRQERALFIGLRQDTGTGQAVSTMNTLEIETHFISSIYDTHYSYIKALTLYKHRR